MDIWKVRGRFPTSEEMSRMVAAEVRARVEATIAQEKAAEEVRVKRRDRLREAYRKHNPDNMIEFDFEFVRGLIEDLAGETLSAWKSLSQLDHIRLAEAGSRDDFNDLEFLINRCLCELNGIKNIVVLARRLA